MNTSKQQYNKVELSELQAAHSELGHIKKELFDWHKDYTRLMTAINACMGVLGKSINELKSSPDEIITDHTIIRYLERYTDYNLEIVKQAIRDLPTTEKRVENNNILTVHKTLKGKL